MSYAVFLEVLARAVSDQKFRQEIFEDPANALRGYDLTPEEMALFNGLDESNWDAFVAQYGSLGPDGSIHPGTGT